MKTFVNYYKIILQIAVLGIFIGVFYIGGINLVSMDMKIVPLQILILLINYPVTIFCLRCTNLEYEIEKYKKENGME